MKLTGKTLKTQWFAFKSAPNCDKWSCTFFPVLIFTNRCQDRRINCFKAFEYRIRNYFLSYKVELKGFTVLLSVQKLPNAPTCSFPCIFSHQRLTLTWDDSSSSEPISTGFWKRMSSTATRRGRHPLQQETITRYLRRGPMFRAIAACPLISISHPPEGAGVGPAQLVSFPHQKTAKDAVEDVSLLGRTSGENMRVCF